MGWVFPNGFGTRALLALVVVGAALWAMVVAGAVAELAVLATVVINYYFNQKANGHMNGGSGA